MFKKKERKSHLLKDAYIQQDYLTLSHEITLQVRLLSIVVPLFLSIEYDLKTGLSL